VPEQPPQLGGGLRSPIVGPGSTVRGGWGRLGVLPSRLVEEAEHRERGEGGLGGWLVGLATRTCGSSIAWMTINHPITTTHPEIENAE
jgi:hypothetical protein